MQTNAFLAQLESDRITKAIGEAEARSLGEIRVHVSNQPIEDAQQAATVQFDRLSMAKTELRNGVLIFVAPKSQKFAVIGDKGIHERCGPTFWQDIATAMEADFRAGRFTDGLVKGVARTGEALATHFPRPHAHQDVNELPDDVTQD